MSQLSKQELNEQIEKYLKERYAFKYNCVANRVEFKRLNKSKEEIEILTDYLANSMRRELSQSGLSISKSDFHCLLNSDYIPTFNPFENYFNNLPEWKEGDPDYISQVALKVKTNNDELWTRCFRKWIVGMVACSLHEETVNQTAIIFTGRQGIGKTTFLKNLVPAKLKGYYFEGTISPNNKDSLSNLCECILINLDELENLTKKDAGGLKEIITKNSIRMRRPYGTINEHFPRRASFCGSVNHKEFLKDTTGNRRFLCFESISFDNGIPIDLDGFYSQAMYLWRGGFQYWFNKDEIKEIDDHNAEYKLMEPEEETLLDCYEPVAEDHKECKQLTTTDIHRQLAFFFKIPNTNASVNQLGKALHANGFERKKRGGQQLWNVRAKIDFKGNKI